MKIQSRSAWKPQTTRDYRRLLQTTTD